MASQSTFCRFFKRSSLESNDEIMRRFNRRWFEMVDIDKHTVDIDSSVISRFKQRVMGGKSSLSLATVRFKCIALGSCIVHRGRSSS